MKVLMEKTMSLPKHVNNGNCPRCELIFNRYPSFNLYLKAWFRRIQNLHPEAHISCAGRGELDQEAAVERKVSRARWGQSAHNYNAAIDIFEMGGVLNDIYEYQWFEKIIGESVTDKLTWYGARDSKFYELPHVELTNWKNMVKTDVLKLVE